MKTTALKKVIEADRQKIIATFRESQTEEMVKYYKSLGKYNDISVDRDGDIILWED